ncbi:hypothetical protein SEPCBS57363_000886 [Sporothrix epigloea]|uniref:Uncharacterized protein n=1 Tax=Sporothrix epigloea TaxID=1892477 RepID=A0ABP0D8B1_9PEZI
MSPETRSSAKATAEAGPSATQGQSIALSSATTDTNQTVTHADLMQFYKQIRAEDDRRREDDNRRREDDNRRREEEDRLREEEDRRREERNLSFQQQSLSFQQQSLSFQQQSLGFQQQSLSFQKLLMDRFGPSPANTSDQPSPSPSLATQIEVETSKPSASADVIDVPDVPDVPDVHAALASDTTTSRSASPAIFSVEADCQIRGEEESYEHLAEVQVETVDAGVTARLTTVEADIDAPAPASVAQPVLAAKTAHSSVKKGKICEAINSREKTDTLYTIPALSEYLVLQTLLSLVPIAKIPYIAHSTVMRTDWLSRPPDMRQQAFNILPIETVNTASQMPTRPQTASARWQLFIRHATRFLSYCACQSDCHFRTQRIHS